MKKFALVTCLAAALSPAAAAPAPPKLIVAISVDQFSTDIFNEYRPYYSSGLKRLSNAIVFPRGHQGHAATETCPGHSTILTGSRPARTGIIANDWQDPSLERKNRDGKPSFEVYCAELPGAAGSNAADQQISSHFLRVPTLGDRMKARDPLTRVLSVSGKDRAAVMMGGPSADVTIWWNGKSFGTYAGKEATLPPALASINARASAAIAKPVTQKLPALCRTHSRAIALPGGQSVGTLKPRAAGNASAWRATPEFDSMTLDAALAGMSALKLGEGKSTDVLAISFSATDYVGHTFGTSGAETCAQIMSLDSIIGRLFATLDKKGIDYTVVLTADHGGHDLPERNKEQALPAAERVDPALSARAVGRMLATRFGANDPVLLGRAPFGDMYVAASVPADKRDAVRDAAVAFYRSHPQVEIVITRQELINSSPPRGPVDEWTLLERAKASFDPQRSGDFIVMLKPYVTPIPDTSAGYVATHGSPWGYDRRVPILFWRKDATSFEQPNAVETVDILPTLASLIGLDIASAEIDGRCLDIVAGPADNCQR